MVRIPKPSDLNQAKLSEHIRHPAQLSSGALSALAASGHAIGNAIANLGGAFGEIAQRRQAADDALNNARYDLAFQQTEREVSEQLANSAGERGEGLEQFPTIMAERVKQLDERYPVSDPTRRELRSIRTQERVEGGSIRMAKAQRDLLGQYYDREEGQLIQGAMEDIRADPSQPNVDQKLAALEQYARGRQGISRDGPSTEARVRENRAILTRAQLEGMDEPTRLEVLEKIRRGQFVLDKEPKGVTIGPVKPGPGGQINPVAFTQRMAEKVEQSPLNGQVPSWGPKFGIETGSPMEWARFFAMIQQQESGHRVARTNPDGTLQRFRTTPKGEKSFGPGQFNVGEYGLKTWADVNDPEKVMDAYINVAKQGKLFQYFGSLQRPRETLQHRAWFDKTVAPHLQAGGQQRVASAEAATDALPPVAAEAVEEMSPQQMQAAFEAAERVRSMVEDNPDSELDDETRATIAQVYPEAKDAKTAGDVAQIMARAEELGMQEQEARDRAGVARQQPRGRAGEWPTGRLAPGQVFEIETRKYGKVRISGDAFSDIGQLKTMHRNAKERVQLTERRARDRATTMLDNQLKSLDETGKDAEGFDLDHVRRVLTGTAAGEKKLREYEFKAAVALKKNDLLRDMQELTTEELQGRLDRERPGQNASRIEREAYKAAAKQATDLATRRERDPAEAVENHPAVVEARNGDNQAPDFRRKLADARMVAQADIGIPPNMRTPMPRREAKAAMDRIVNLPDGQILQQVSETARRWGSEIGPENAKRAMEYAIDTYVRDEGTRNTVNRALKDYFTKGEISQKTIRQMIADTGMSDGVDAPASTTKESFFSQQTVDIIRAQFKVRNPEGNLPTERDIRRLIYHRHNLQAHKDFDEGYFKGASRIILEHHGVFSEE